MLLAAALSDLAVLSDLPDLPFASRCLEADEHPEQAGDVFGGELIGVDVEEARSSFLRGIDGEVGECFAYQRRHVRVLLLARVALAEHAHDQQGAELCGVHFAVRVLGCRRDLVGEAGKVERRVYLQLLSDGFLPDEPAAAADSGQRERRIGRGEPHHRRLVGTQSGKSVLHNVLLGTSRSDTLLSTHDVQLNVSESEVPGGKTESSASNV